MDPDSETKIKNQGNSFSFIQRYLAYVGDVLSPLWLRRIIQVNDGSNWFILGSRYRFLFNFRLFLVVLYILIEINK